MVKWRQTVSLGRFLMEPASVLHVVVDIIS